MHIRELTDSSVYLWALLQMLSTEEEITVNILDISAQYRYEYLGQVNRLVITPNTLKSFLALLTAFKACYFGSLEGSAKQQTCDSFISLSIRFNT